MNWKQITRIVILVAIFGLALYDVFAVAFGGVDATISRIWLNEFNPDPIIVFALGIVFGHLVWPQTKKVQREH